MKPRLLDLFCGAGGCSVGYARAGFEVVGVDVAAQPNYPFEFVQADASEILDWFVSGHTHELSEAVLFANVFDEPFDAIHASPPCQGYSTMANRFPEKKAEYPLLIAEVRGLLKATGLPFVIENVMGARKDMESPAVICGRSLDLGVQRHRLFETNFPLLVPPCVCGKGDKPIVGVYGQRPDGRRLNSRSVHRIQYAASSLEEGQAAMGIDWMPWRPLTQAIPPAYCELIGAQLMQYLRASGRVPGGSLPEHTLGTGACPDRKTDSRPHTDDPAGSGSSAHSPQATSEASGASSPQSTPLRGDRDSRNAA